MSHGKGFVTLIEEQAFARSGLVGNPSDIFGGKVLSLLFDAFQTNVTLYESPRLQVIPNDRDRTSWRSIDNLLDYRHRFGYYGGMRLIEAVIVRFKILCDQHSIPLPRRTFTIEYRSNIPFAVGLGGSSAIGRAVLAALMRFYELDEADIPLPLQANILLEAETEELGISAGPQDRVVMVYGGVVAMDFTPQAYAGNNGEHGDYRPIDPSLLPQLYVVYNESLSKGSGTIHNVMRYRASVEHDQSVLEAMRDKALLVDEAVAALQAGNADELGPIMSRDFDLRAGVYDLPRQQTEMIGIARAHGSHAKFAGSGGAAIGTYDDADHLRRLTETFRTSGYTTVPVQVAHYSHQT